MLPMQWWVVAWDSYAMGATVTGQMAFKTAMLHKHWVLEVASSGGEAAGPLYDDLVRTFPLPPMAFAERACPTYQEGAGREVAQSRQIRTEGDLGRGASHQRRVASRW